MESHHTRNIYVHRQWQACMRRFGYHLENLGRQIPDCCQCMSRISQTSDRRWSDIDPTWKCRFDVKSTSIRRWLLSGAQTNTTTVHSEKQCLYGHLLTTRYRHFIDSINAETTAQANSWIYRLESECKLFALSGHGGYYWYHCDNVITIKLSDRRPVMHSVTIRLSVICAANWLAVWHKRHQCGWNMIIVLKTAFWQCSDATWVP